MKELNFKKRRTKMNNIITIEKNLLDLEYNRYLEKSHTFYNSLITITLGILAIVITGILSKEVRLSFQLVYYMLYPIATIWFVIISLITFTRIKRIKIRKQLRDLRT